MLHIEFKNSERQSIDNVYLQGENEKIPALSALWLENRALSKYVPLKLKNGRLNHDFEEDAWISELRRFNQDLEWILSLNFHRFWSHVIYDKEFLNPLLFFLQESTPFYIPLRKVLEDSEVAPELYDLVCKNALLIICRLITNRESDAEFMTKEKQAEIIYGEFIISIPMIFDMLALYGYSNKELMQKILDTLLKIEPKYMNDLKVGIKFIAGTFETMKKQLDVIESSNSELFEKYEDLSLYLMNIATTLNLLIDLAPNEVKGYCTRDLHLEQSIASLYDNFIPLLHQYSLMVDDSAWFLSYINFSRVELINCFRNLVNRGILSILNAGEKNRKKYADGVLGTLTECAGYKIFIADYAVLYPVDIDLDIITQSSRNVDKVKLDFVADAFKIIAPSNGYVKSTNGYHNPVDIQDEFEDIEGACALPLPKEKSEALSSVEDIFQLETSKILELFPSYGVGYIRRLLAFYDNSSEKVIEKVLEGNLDSTFNGCDEAEPYIPPDTPDKVFLATGITRSNVYDGDKFDVFTNDEFGGHVKKNGNFITKKTPKTYHELFNDKSHVEALKERYQGYGLVNESVDDVEYDDEYDDSYDGFAESEPKAPVRMHNRMREMLPDTLDLPESEEEEDNHHSDAPKKNPLDFCENPEVIRARREQAFQHRMAKKHPTLPQPEPKTRDVVGNQKGQGQSNEVLRNRTNKNTNKSSRANHNRKAGSSFKQSRGMF